MYEKDGSQSRPWTRAASEDGAFAPARHKIAAIGDRDSITGLAALGLEIFPVEEAVEAARLLKSLAGGGYAVIYITEALAAQIPEEIGRYRYARIPAVILIPGLRGNTGAGLRNISISVEKAVGSDIIS